MGSDLCHELFTWRTEVLCLGGVIFLSISGKLGVYAISATFAVCLVVYLNKHNIDIDVCVS